MQLHPEQTMSLLRLQKAFMPPKTRRFETSKSIIGYTLTSTIGDAGLNKGVNSNVELYSDGSYKNLGAVNNRTNTITLDAGETAQSVLVTFHSTTPNKGTRGAFAFMVLRVNQTAG